MDINPKTEFDLGTTADCPEHFFTMLPPAAVHATHFPGVSDHNAIWDFGAGPEGRWYAALCGELSNPLSAELYEYRPGEDRLVEVFAVDRRFCVSPREIPPSKIHTSLHPTRDGRLVMTTHTTARSPRHPYWLFDSHYYHAHEGYPGSSVLLFNPENGHVDNLGIPVKRDSIYGACYDWKHHALWFVTYLKGRLCRLDLESLQVEDFGQVTEFGSFMIQRDRLGNLYLSSRSGQLLHVDVDRRVVTSLGFPCDEPENNPLWRCHRMIGGGVTGPDGRLYLSILYSDRLVAVDPETRRLELISLVPTAGWGRTPAAAHRGLAFDAAGVLWRLECRTPWDRPGGIIHLIRHDLLRGGAPECMGVVGTPDRVTITVSETHMAPGDQLLIADTNHYDDMPRMLRIDLAKLSDRTLARPAAAEVSPYLLTADGRNRFPGTAAQWEAQTAHAQRFIDECNDCFRFLSREADTGVALTDVRVLRLWRAMPWGTVGGVRRVAWRDADTLRIYAGDAGATVWDWTAAAGLRRVTADAAAAEMVAETPRMAPELARSGRRFAAAVTVRRRWHDGRWLIGTADGVLGLEDPATGRIFRLGPVAAHGPIHDLATDAAGRVAYGVAGDADDLGMVFRFDDLEGLRELGRLNTTPPGEVVAANTEPVCLAVTPDGGRVAVGCAGNLAAVYIWATRQPGK